MPKRHTLKTQKLAASHTKSHLPGMIRLIVYLPLLVVSAWSCSPTGDNKAAAAPPMPEVKAAQPVRQTVTDWDEFTGHIEAIDAVDVRPRVSGYLDKINFKAGAKVKKGDLLFVIDPKPLKAQLNFAQAELKQAKVKLELAKNDANRAERLFKVKGISEEEYDSRSKGLAEAAAALQSAQANVETAQLNLDYTEVRSPIDGRITREQLTLGNLVNGGTAGEATLLATIVSTDPVYAYVDADESAVLKYRRTLLKSSQGAVAGERIQVSLALADETDFPHQGILDYISPREDSATGTVSLRAVFDNPDELLAPGYFARVRIQGSVPYPALLIPDKAIGRDQAQRFVWVVKDNGEVEYRKVTIGPHIDGLRAIKEGVGEGDWVVVEGIQKIRPGATVKATRIGTQQAADEAKP